MKGKVDPNRCSIVVTGEELVELKRHAHDIPDCPGLDRRIHRCSGKGPLVMSRDELDWLVAVLDAVLHDPKGYPCVEYDPWKLEYVPATDKRCKTCQRLYDKLRQESDSLWKALKQRRGSRAIKSDPSQSRIAAVIAKRGCPAVVRPMSRGYAIFDDDDRSVALIRPRKEWWEVLWWSHREKWESIGDMGGVIFDTVKEAANYVLKDPMGIFWR